MKNKKRIIALIAFVAVVGILAGLWFATRPQTQQGSKTVTVIVIHADGTEVPFTYQTDKQYLGELLYAEGLIQNDGVDDGMFNVVHGEKADWNENKSYWSFYEGDAYANQGVDTTVIQDGAVYKLVYTLG